MLEVVAKVFPSSPLEWQGALARELEKSKIDTKEELASFFSQLHHESRGLTVFEENLYYSTPQRLCLVWPSRFAMPDSQGSVPAGRLDPHPYARNPQGLANYVYADANRHPKFALGNTEPGDGWKYRGMGPPQITGKNNYRKCGEAIGADLLKEPELLRTPLYGVKSAIWFWDSNGFDSLDDDLDVRAETRLLNGGETGLKDRQLMFNTILDLLKGL